MTTLTATRPAEGRLPDFLVIGAMKAGTTTLHGLLKRHPDIFMPEEKEQHFFSYNGRFRKGLDHYAALFDGAVPLCGECSPSYAAYPSYPEAASRIADSLPDVKLVYCVRDPISRALSHYKHMLALGRERRGVDEALRDSFYHHQGRYAVQLSRYYEAGIPPERVYLVQAEAMRKDRAGEMSALFAFLGAAPDKADVSGTRDWHVSAKKRVPSQAGLSVKQAISPLTRRLPWSIRTHAERIALYPFTRPMPAVAPKEETTSALQDVFAEDADRLRRMSGHPLPGWAV